MRRARVDSNQPEVVAALRAAGATVHCLHSVGGGFPDIIVGYRGVNYLMEIKDGRKPPSRRRLNKLEAKWHDAWRGQVCVVESVEDALAVISEVHDSG